MIIIPEGEILTAGQFKDYVFATEVLLPKTLVKIPRNCFEHCYSLKKVVIPGNVKIIEEGAFSMCGLEEVILQEGVERIGKNAFWFCDKLKKIVIPKSVKHIDPSAFYCSGLEEVVFQEGIKQIWDGAFEDCHKLERVVMPKTLETIRKGAFQYSGLKKIEIPDSVKTIGDSAFFYCKYLEEVYLSEGLEKIGDCAFRGCDSIRYLNLPNSLKHIGAAAFSDTFCDEIIVPNNIQEIGNNAFSNCHCEYNQFEFFCKKNSVAAKYFESEKIEYKTKECKTGLLRKNILYKLNEDSSCYEISTEITSIANNACKNHLNLEKLLFHSGLTEVGEYAFSNCKNLNAIEFCEGLIKIGKGAFKNTGLTYVDLPSTVNVIDPEAFDNTCVVSVAGEMPFYNEKLDEINKRQQEVDVKENGIESKTTRKQTLQEALDNYIKSEPKEFTEIDKIQAEVAEIEKARIDNSRDYISKKDALAGLIKQKEEEKNTLLLQRKKCFILATNKKKDLDAQIQNKQKELQILYTEQQQLEDQFNVVDKSFKEKLEPKQRWIAETQNAKMRRVKDLEVQKDVIARIDSELCEEIKELKKLKEALKKDIQKLEREHENWQKAKDEVLTVQKNKELTEEKNAILSTLIFPEYDKIPVYEFVADESNCFERLLNKAYLEKINNENNCSEADTYNQCIKDHQKDLLRIVEINQELNLDENDGITQFYIREVLNANIEIPECFKATYDFYSKTDNWKTLSQLVNNFEIKNRLKSNLKEFFKKLKLICLSNDNTQLLVMPQCIVRYKENEPLSVFTYNKVSIKLTHKDEEYESENIPPHGEVISEQYKHLNKDGSVSKRYSYNPLVKTVRYTTATIKFGDKTFSFPIDTYQAALQFEEAFNNYCQLFANGEYADLYKTLINTEDVEVIKAEIKKYEDAKKKRIEEEKKQKEAEELAAKLAAEEERKRLEEERIAAQIAAEEKRKALIQKQKEINEERKRQAEEQRRILSIFEDEAEVQEPVQREENTLATHIEVISKCLISNNVFKVEVKQLQDFNADCATCYFISVDGTVISNKKKLTNFKPGTQSTIGFILASGIDFTQMNSCYMCIEANEKVIGKIEFKMNISFYSDF